MRKVHRHELDATSKVCQDHRRGAGLLATAEASSMPHRSACNLCQPPQVASLSCHHPPPDAAGAEAELVTHLYSLPVQLTGRKLTHSHTVRVLNPIAQGLSQLQNLTGLQQVPQAG